MAAESPRLTLLSRDRCHLCHEMVDALQALDAELPFVLEVRDIDADPRLAVRYGGRVPVLLGGEEELCHYRLDAAAVNAWLAKFR